MKNLLQPIKENKKMLIAVILLITAYTAHASYIVWQNTELKAKNVLLSQPSEIEMKAQAVTDLRTEWGKIQKDLLQCEKLNDYKVNDLEPRIRQAEKDLLGKK